MPRSKRDTGGKSSLLEDCVRSLTLVGFQVYENQAHYNQAEIRPERYIIRNYPHISLYGTPGRKEAYLVSADVDYILEAKWQDVGGSVDEKLPYIFHCFLDSPVTHWIAVLDGRYWTRNARALAGVGWLRAQPVPPGRKLYVFTRRQFIEWARGQWSNGAFIDGRQRVRAQHQEERARRADWEENQELLFRG